MKPNAFQIACALLILLSLACGGTPAANQVRPTLQASLQTALPTIQSSLETAIPTLQSGLQTGLQPALPSLPAGVGAQPLQPGAGLPLPGTLIPQLVGQLNQAQAALAIEAYARDVLGIEIKVTVGRGTVGDMSLPISVESGATMSLQLSGVSYFGLVQNGAASLSLGSGTASGDLTGAVQDASLGMFSLSQVQDAPASPTDALALVQAVYPGLAKQNLVLVDQTRGYTFQTSSAQDWSVAGGQLTLKGSVVSAGVSTGRLPGRVVVWTIVASGLLAAPFIK